MATSKNKRYRALRKNVSGPTKEQRKKEETALHEAGLRRGSTKLANIMKHMNKCKLAVGTKFTVLMLCEVLLDDLSAVTETDGCKLTIAPHPTCRCHHKGLTHQVNVALAACNFSAVSLWEQRGLEVRQALKSGGHKVEKKKAY